VNAPRFFQRLLLSGGLLAGLLWFPPPGRAQEAAAPKPSAAEPDTEGPRPETAEAPVDTPAEPTLPAEEGLTETKVLAMDIKTSTLRELADWCRRLGLSEAGGREAMTNRLREYYQLTAPEDGPAEAAASNKKTIIIESARSTEYFTLEVVDEEYARLRGDVLVSLKDGDTSHRIKAQEILYNRTRNILSAYGGVEYVKEDGDTTETYRGESITVNLDDWSSSFMDSISERSLTGDATTYRFSGRLITRSSEEATVLTGAEIANALNEESYWSIKASKLWLLPGSDWAIFNGVLYVGEIPVLYIPFFFYPADEVVFHPVVGYRSREGNFAQTTTYLLGRPKADPANESSINKILGSNADTERVLEGIFLRSTGRKSRDPNTTRLSLLLDAYANLGAYLGTELTLPQRGALKSLAFSGGIGLTRNIYRDGDSYMPFAPGSGAEEWNMSRFFSTAIPLRYRMETAGSLSGAYGALSWGFPFFSDPYVNRDFMNRSESMDWFNMIKQGNNLPKEEEDQTKNTIGSHEWRLTGSITPKIDALKPYVSSFSISNISSTLGFSARNSLLYQTADPSPSRVFFFPNKFTFLTVTTGIAGTPLTLGNQGASPPSPKAGAGADALNAQDAADLLEDIGAPRPPWKAAEEQDALDRDKDVFQLTPPVLEQTFNLLKAGGPRFTIDYQLNPTVTSELQFRSSSQHWPEAVDVDWGEASSVITLFRTDGGLTFKLTDPDTNAYTQSFRFYGNASWQDHSYINEEAEEFDTQGERDAAEIRDNTARFYSFSTETITTLNPFPQSLIWKNTNLKYTLVNLLVRSQFNNSVEDPQWEPQWGEWEPEYINTHTFGVNLAASVMDKAQTLSVSHELPPKDHTLTADGTFRIWISETVMRQKVLKPFVEEERKFDPFSFNETLRFHEKIYAKQSFYYDPEENRFNSLTASLTLDFFTLSYMADRSKPYELIPGLGWALRQNEEEEFSHRELRFDLSKSFTKQGLWNNRLSVSFNAGSSFAFDLRRYTNTRLTTSLGITVGIARFLDLSLSTNSENAVMFRYFQDWPVFDLPVELAGEKDFFKDLFNSFRFDDESLRKSSGFKLKSFTLSATHHLGDWNAKLSVTLSPYLDQTSFPYQYKFNNEISFVVQWIPITEIKTDLYVNKEEYFIR
jgi:hypothetical protein